jgi:hypothetical protein
MTGILRAKALRRPYLRCGILMKMRANRRAESERMGSFVVNVVIALGFMMKGGVPMNDK